MSTAKDLLVIDVSEVTYCPDPNDPHNPPRDVRERFAATLAPPDWLDVRVNPTDETMIDITIPVLIAAPLDRRRPPVRDIREAMYPEDGRRVAVRIGRRSHPRAVGEGRLPCGCDPTIEACDDCGHLTMDQAREAMHPADDGAAMFAGKLLVRDDDGLLVPSDPTACRSCSRVAGFEVKHPGACPVAEGHRLCITPHVATLPDGSRVNLPAGTVLREGKDDMADDAADQFFDDVCKLIPWEKPDVPERREVLRIIGQLARAYFPPPK